MEDYLQGGCLVVQNSELHAVSLVADKSPTVWDVFDRVEFGFELMPTSGVVVDNQVVDDVVEVVNVGWKGFPVDEGAIWERGNVIEDHGTDTNDGLYYVTMSLLKYNFR